MPVALDVQDEDAVAALAERVYAEWGRCDLLDQQRRRSPRPGPRCRTRSAAGELAVDVNLNGPFYLSWHLGRRMADAGGGRVINVSSAAAVMPEFGRPSYTATKLALEGLTESLGHELAGRLAVNCIRIDIPIWSEGFEATLPGDFDTSGFEDAGIMSDAVLWLARQDAVAHGQDPHPHRAAPARHRAPGDVPPRPRRLIAIRARLG